MKIVHYMARISLEDGGVVRAVLDLCGALAHRGHELTLLANDSSDVPETWHSGGDGLPRVLTLQCRSGLLPKLTRSATLDAQQIIQEADVVHLHVPWDPICVQLGRIARKAGVTEKDCETISGAFAYPGFRLELAALYHD